MKEKKFKDIVLEKMHNELLAVGMKKKKGVYIKDINDETLGWLGLNRMVRRKGTYIEINPVIGVRNHHIETLTDEICHQIPQKYLYATISIPLGYLMPQHDYLPLEFNSDSEIEPVISEFSQNLREYGFPFFEKHSTLAQMRHGLENTLFYLPLDTEYRLAVCYYLLEEYQRASEYLQHELDKLKNETYEAADDFRAFADGLFSLINEKL